MSKIKLSETFIKDRVKLALTEDLYPNGDITSELIKSNTIKSFKIISNQNGIVGGLDFAKNTFTHFDKEIKFDAKKKDGSKLSKGSTVAIIKGNTKNILICERAVSYTHLTLPTIYSV